jgi:hypothetical protein
MSDTSWLGAAGLVAIKSLGDVVGLSSVPIDAMSLARHVESDRLSSQPTSSLTWRCCEP